jgi:hypothetical protein
VFEGAGDESLGWETGKFEEGLVDYCFVFVLFVSADVPVGGEGFS